MYFSGLYISIIKVTSAEGTRAVDFKRAMVVLAQEEACTQSLLQVFLDILSFPSLIDFYELLINRAQDKTWV